MQARRNGLARESFLARHGVFEVQEAVVSAGYKTRNPAEQFSRWLAAGKVFAVETAGRRVLPAFQFDPISGQQALHEGIDFIAQPGTPIVAAAGGVVLAAEAHHQFGNMIEIDHGGDIVTRYAHASLVHVKPGEIVKRGQIIAEVGSTGRSTGPHLHFEVRIKGVAQNPTRFLVAAQKPGSVTAPKVAEAARPAPAPVVARSVRREPAPIQRTPDSGIRETTTAVFAPAVTEH